MKEFCDMCPRCGHKNIGEEYFCERCLYDLTECAVQEYYKRWMW